MSVGWGSLRGPFSPGARVTRAQWNAGAFAANGEMTLASLVPAQVSDLVELASAGSRESAGRRGRRRSIAGRSSTPSARTLGWPLLPSYGMTETCSQVATATLRSPELLLLDHVEARTEPDGRLAFRGPSLLSGYATEGGFVDPKTSDGWFVTEDLGSRRGGQVARGGAPRRFRENRRRVGGSGPAGRDSGVDRGRRMQPSWPFRSRGWGR